MNLRDCSGSCLCFLVFFFFYLLQFFHFQRDWNYYYWNYYYYNCKIFLFWTMIIQPKVGLIKQLINSLTYLCILVSHFKISWNSPQCHQSKPWLTNFQTEHWDSSREEHRSTSLHCQKGEVLFSLLFSARGHAFPPLPLHHLWHLFELLWGELTH